MIKKESEKIIKRALWCAQKAFQADEIPVGAVIFNSQTGDILITAYNQTEEK